MSDTPGNNIEKQLQDYAKQRRDAVGTPEMHPATRAMLQAEMKKRLGTPQPQTQPSGWAHLWPKIAFACGVVAVLGIVAMFILPATKQPKESFTLAKFEEADQSQPSVAPLESMPASEPVTASALMKERIQFAGDAQPVSANNAPVVAAPSISVDSLLARDESAATRKRAEEFAGGQVIITGSIESPADRTKNVTLAATSESDTTKSKLAQPVKVATAVASGKKDVAITVGAKPGSVAAKSALADKDAAPQLVAQTMTNKLIARTSQLYRNTATTDGDRKGGQLPVLEEFTVAQDGELLTIVDRDGSIYNGCAYPVQQSHAMNNYKALEAANPVQLVPNSGSGGRAGAALDQRAMNNRNYSPLRNAHTITLDNAGQMQSQSLQNMNATGPACVAFRVEGTNRSLNQRVVVTGNFLNPAGFSDIGFQNSLQNFGNAANFQDSFNSRAQTPVFNNAINGRVQLGDSREAELNALPARQ